MPQLILARHGQTDWNPRSLFQGRSDLPLNAAGLAQSHALAQRLRNDPMQHLISSDLQRARQTAEAIAAAHAEPPALRLDERLREIHYGKWEGLNEAGIEAILPGEVERWKHDPSFAPADGESVVQVMARLEGLVEELRGLPAGDTVVLVSHSGAFQALLCVLLGVLPQHWWPFKLSNASISRVELRPLGARLIQLNDCGHME